MIISASRRTDIPAFYGQWLLNRLRQGQVMVRHPFNPNRVTQLSLAAETIDAFVFWTKNPAPFMERLGEIEHLGHQCCFQYTLTPYGTDLEPRVPPLTARIAAFRALADRIGPERVVWRYDPILFTPFFSPDEHLRCFAALARQLHQYTRCCTVSLLSLYAKCRRNLQTIALVQPQEEELITFATDFAAIARDHGLSLSACCDGFLTDRCGMEASRCIDPGLLSAILGRPVTDSRDRSQRPGCGCAVSVDIGAYNTCPYGCRYCYANSSEVSVSRQVANHDPGSPLLTGQLRGDETIIVKQGTPIRSKQLSLF